MRKKLKLGGLSDEDNSELNKQMESWFKDEVDERKRDIDAKSALVLSSVPRPSELAEGIIVVGRDGTTFKLYAKCADGTMRSVTVT